MKKVLALVVSLLTGGIVVGAADRIFTNPKPEGHFKKLFPNAVAFSPFGGTPPHYKAYAADPKANPSGLSRASAVIFELVHQIGAKVVANDDPALVAAVLALESYKPIQKPWKKLVSALDASAVARARGDGPSDTEAAAPAKKKAAPRKKAT